MKSPEELMKGLEERRLREDVAGYLRHIAFMVEKEQINGFELIWQPADRLHIESKLALVKPAEFKHSGDGL